MTPPNHRHHHGCSECGEARKERDALRAVGMGWGSSQALQLHRKQLARLGMDWKEIERAMKIIHPPLMANLKLTAAGRIVPVDRRLYWERRLGWDRKAAVLRREREAHERWRKSQRSSMRLYYRNIERRAAAERAVQKLRRKSRHPAPSESLFARRRGIVS